MCKLLKTVLTLYYLLICKGEIILLVIKDAKDGSFALDSILNSDISKEKKKVP